VILRFYSFGALVYQRRVLHQLSLPYLLEDRDSSSYHDLTKKFSLVKGTNANLKSDNEKLQESLTSLQTIHTALEVQFNTLLESSSKTSETSNSSSPSASNGCAWCFNIDIHTFATNYAETNTMKKDITRLTQLFQEEAPLHKQVPKANSSSRVGEFERHTKRFGSKYMNKNEFEKGKGLGKNEQGAPQTIPFVKNKKTATLGTNGDLVNMTTPIRKGNGKIQETSHVKFVKGGNTCDEGDMLHPHQGKISSKPQAQSTPRHKNYPLMNPFMQIMC
jgi:hypothetical protein